MKENAKHTPGPWGVIENSDQADMIVSICKEKIDGPRIVVDPDSGIMGRDVAQAIANACLIAAAPELLAACKYALSKLPLDRKGEDTYLRLAEAVNKAEGR